MTRPGKTYDYRPVRCPQCGWRGRRSFRTFWPACPKCHNKGSNILATEQTLEARAENARRRAEHQAHDVEINRINARFERQERAELARLKAIYEKNQ